MLTDNMDLPLMSTPEKFKMIKHNIYTVLPILVMNLILKFGRGQSEYIQPCHNATIRFQEIFNVIFPIKPQTLSFNNLLPRY